MRKANGLTNNKNPVLHPTPTTQEQRAELPKDRLEPVSRILERTAPDREGNAQDKAEALAQALRTSKNKTEL